MDFKTKNLVLKLKKKRLRISTDSIEFSLSWSWGLFLSVAFIPSENLLKKSNFYFQAVTNLS